MIPPNSMDIEYTLYRHVLCLLEFRHKHFWFAGKEIWRTKIWWSGSPIYRTSSTDPVTIEIMIKYFKCYQRMVCWITLILKSWYKKNGWIHMFCRISNLKFSSNVGSSFFKMSRYVSPFKLPLIMWQLILIIYNKNLVFFTAELYA